VAGVEYWTHGQGEEVAIMNKLSRGIIGFVVGGGLAFLLFTVWLNSEGIGAEDVVQYLQLFLGLPVSLFGGMIGAAIGIGIAHKADDSNPPDSPEKRLRKE
jgi:hypothetical protein